MNMGSRATYQRMAETRDWKNKITPDLKSFIEERDSFYMATSNEEGQPYIQHRGGPKGFLKVMDDETLAFADYSGNRQYISIGNLDDNQRVHLFLMDYPNQTRVKIWGEAKVIHATDPQYIKAIPSDYKAKIERILSIKITAWDINCPQHIQRRFTLEELQPHLKALHEKIESLEDSLAQYQQASS